jgi:hypothetical protein
MKNLVLSALAAAFLAAGCALPDANNSEPVVEREYTTGSNIARRPGGAKPGVVTIEKETLDREPMPILKSPASGPKGG